MSREQQMMNAADRYADEVCDESCTGAQVAETINDFCAGWRAADAHPHWIPVEERLPEKEDDYLVLDCKRRVVAAFDPSDKTWWESDGNCIVSVFPTHWMPIVSPRKEE